MNTHCTIMFGTILLLTCAVTEVHLVIQPTSAPRNAVAEQGQAVNLNCGIDARLGFAVGDGQVSWYFLQDGNTGAIIAQSVSGASIAPDFATYDFEVTQNGDTDYNLRISSIDTRHANEYRCVQTSPAEDERVAYVTVIGEGGPVCSEVTGTVAEGDSVDYSCSVVYRGAIVPTLQWIKVDDDQPVEGVNVRAELYTQDSNPRTKYQTMIITAEFSQTMTSAHNNIQFRCVINFNDAPPAEEDYDDSIPSYNGARQCETPPLDVQYAPREVRKDPDRDVHDEGEYITCTSNANPVPHLYQWVDVLSGAILETVADTPSTLLITADMKGERSFKCIVTNMVGNENYTAEETFNFTVQIPTTVAPTTLPTTRSTRPTSPGGPTPGERRDGTTQEPDSDSLSSGAIAGIIVGCILAVIIIVIIIICCCRKCGGESEKSKPKKFGVDTVRQPDIQQVAMPPRSDESMEDTKPPSLYNAGYDGSQNGPTTPSYNPDYPPMYGADLALDNTPRSRHPIQVYETSQPPPPTIYDTLKKQQQQQQLQHQSSMMGPPTPTSTTMSTPSPYQIGDYSAYNGQDHNFA